VYMGRRRFITFVKGNQVRMFVGSYCNFICGRFIIKVGEITQNNSSKKIGVEKLTIFNTCSGGVYKQV